MKRTYTFDDVALAPQFNNVPSRTEPSLETWLTKSRKMDIPILAANMDTVIGEELAEILLGFGSVPIFYRFTDYEVKKKWVKKYGDRIFISSGIHHIDETRRLFDLGLRGVCIDVAHGHSNMMFKFIEELKKTHPGKEIIAGNICTSMACHDLINAGADAVKVGIGPGAACTTRMVTGFGVAQFTAIRDCSKITDKLRVPLIADGGIRSSREVVIALAAGASSVMIGKLFALTKESAAPKREKAGSFMGLQAKYRGQSSEDFQNDFYGGLKDKTVAEGVDFWADVTVSAKELIESLLGGLRSGMTYGGARSIKELQRKAEFVEVSSTYMYESFVRE